MAIPDRRGGLILRPPLSGGRSYVFAGDLFVALSEAMEAEPEAVLRLSRLTDHALDLRCDAPLPDDPCFAGTFHFHRAGQPQAVWLRRRDDDPIQERVAGTEGEGLVDVTTTDAAATAQATRVLPLARAFLALAVGYLRKAEPGALWTLAAVRAAGPLQGAGALQVAAQRRLGRFIRLGLQHEGQDWGDMTLAATPKGEA